MIVDSVFGWYAPESDVDAVKRFGARVPPPPLRLWRAAIWAVVPCHDESSALEVAELASEYGRPPPAAAAAGIAPGMDM